MTTKQGAILIIGTIIFALILIFVPKVEVADLRKQLQQPLVQSPPSSFPFGLSPLFGLTPFNTPPASPNPLSLLDVVTAEDKARQTLATALGGVLVLIGAYLTWRNVRATEDKQITDRFTAAVTNLSANGREKMAQRLGGIYALERIARDSPKDHWTVMEVLTAYVRDKRQKDLGRGRMETPTDIPTDVQATLTVIGRRDIEQDKGRKLDIYRVDLFKVYLAGANLRGAVMGENFMMQADLTGADLAGAYLAEADLTGADLRRANLWKANLWKADLLDADLTGVRMQGTELHECENLTQQQLNAADQKLIPASLPPGLTFPGYVVPSPPPMPPA